MPFSGPAQLSLFLLFHTVWFEDVTEKINEVIFQKIKIQNFIKNQKFLKIILARQMQNEMRGIRNPRGQVGFVADMKERNYMQPVIQIFHF